uniref:Retrotransposon gag domain-containing protein n=1 Tax=Anopheles epiroticus TaxID=199890 RepID=A0A182PWP0_9DIPT
MGTEMNNAFKFLVTPKQPEEIPYADLRKTLENHFDRNKNKFVENVKFRNIVQQKGETIAQFVLRLKQGAAY